ncbi:hypothetical protein EI546_15585 [Aequorivita sp. H23M31]|uniref:Uncharacterized protein n=1 Tax=Aequorivita ciconiae TaxID=2494375 RepID=A0A410G6X4_9FLAO|nr:hypothetical protein [Aequorivita sp. H23M31]QAA83049.1 hypothetical protein EI546_15585 [Aequorivita sp. H23M31]
MGFGGSAAAMILTLRNNAKQLAKRNNYFEKDIPSKYPNSAKIIDYKKMSPQQFDTFKQNLKKEERRRLIIVTIVFGTTMIFFVGIVVYFLFYH